MTTPSEPVEIYCLKCKARTGSKDIEIVTMKNGRLPLRLRGVRHQEVPHRRSPLMTHRVAHPITHRHIPGTSWRWTWA